jgi:hypothetical protein
MKRNLLLALSAIILTATISLGVTWKHSRATLTPDSTKAAAVDDGDWDKWECVYACGDKNGIELRMKNGALCTTCWDFQFRNGTGETLKIVFSYRFVQLGTRAYADGSGDCVLEAAETCGRSAASSEKPTVKVESARKP